MHHNYKLKRAVAIALSLISIGSQGNALALGLSDIEVKSHLGQPLKAKINVFGAEGLKDASCFKLGNNDENTNQLTNAHFKLGPVNGDEATLTVTTSQIINEPILNLSVVAECDSTVQRSYVLLIDPLLTAEVDVASDEEATNIVENTSNPEKKSVVSKHKHQVSSSNNNSQTLHQDKKSRKNKVAATANDTNIVLHVPGGNLQTQSNAAENATTNSSKPRLSISGGATNLPINAVNLRLDRQLTFTPDANAQTAAQDAEVLDEVTAMNNRLAHLKEQINALQQENVKLASDNKLKTLQLAKADSLESKFYSAAPLLGGALMLVGGYFGFTWWRRRQLQTELLDEIEPVWTNLPVVDKEIDEFSSFDEEDIFAEQVPAQNQMSVAEKSTLMQESFESTKVVEEAIVVDDNNEQGLTVLDHADVFLSHGRASLAIQLLQNHLLDHPKQSVTIWLFLLDLLAKENMQPAYEKTALECKEYFNIKIADFAKSESTTNHSLESFPHLAEGLQQVWNTPAAIVYLDDLIYNNRLEPRTGLDKNLIEELILLKSIAQENLSSAEVIQLDAKKVALKEQKEAIIAAKKAEKLEELKQAERLEVEKAEALAKEQEETKFDFKLVEWN